GVRAIEAALRHRAGGRPLRYWMPDPSGLVERQGSEALAAPERLKAMMAEGCLLADIGTVQNLLSATAAFHGFDKVADLIEHAYATHGDRTGSEMQLAYSHLHQSIVLAHARGARSFTEELADERQGQKAAPRPEPGPKPAKAAPAKERQEPDGTLVQQDLAETHYETPKAAAEGTGEHMEEKDDNLHYAEVSLRVSPLPTGRGLRIVDRTKPDGRIKSLREVPAKGAESSAKYGVNWSFPVSDALVEILKVKFEKGSEGFGAYHTAAFNAFQQAIKATGVRFMEPVGQVRIHLQDPTEGNIGGAQVVIGKVRGATDVREDRDDGWTLTCVAPLAERKRIDGGLEHLKLDPSRCLFEMTPCGHAPLPQDLEAAVLSAERERVIAAAQKK
ncbi:MAG: hypothetical protein KDE22_13870, partial [Rhodobacterales bacterium]|nr:hypothetical protein [Rhodobacterales bacterium]